MNAHARSCGPRYVSTSNAINSYAHHYKNQYHDPDYEGYSIGEYQFFDWTTNTWDESTCQTERCAKMDCHLPDTRYELLGIFTETDGLNDWAEQLFKHQGYCLWDGDKQQDGQDNDEEGDYNFMQEQRENWSRDCEQGDVTDRDGNSLYIGVKPMPFGQMTYGVYSDEACIVEVDMTIREYMLKYYVEEKEYSSAEAQYYVADYLNTIKRWNSLMHDYRTCQPCRAYNKVPMYNNNNRLQRNLNDGNGDNEMWGYDCYDDAGYTNCNQCYKFGSQTDMEAATLDDLRRATAQGSIVEIDVDGVLYGGSGSAHYDAFSLTNPQVILLFICLCLIWAIFFYVARKLLYNRIVRCFRRVPTVELNEKLHSDDADADTAVASEANETANPYQQAADDLMEEIVEEHKKDKARTLLNEMESSVSERDNEITNLAFQLDMERTKFSLERQRMTERMEALQQQLSDYQNES